MNYKVSHPTKVVECEIDLPSSKSISNRLLIIKALCKEDFEIKNLSDSDDTISLQKALVNNTETIDVGAAGTTFRFLTAYLAIREGKECILTGTDRMKERPIIELIGALQSLGVEIKYTEKDGFPPLNIKGSTLKGGKITIDGAVSSQFISALLMIAPILKNGITLIIEGKIVSKPYIEMTLNLMQEFGVLHSWNGNKIEIKPQKYVAKNIAVEADWSAAAFWFEIAALSNSCNIKLNGLKQNSMQGDKKAVEIFDDLVVDSTFENGKLILIKKERWISPFKTYDLIETPDLYQPLRCTLFSKDIDGNFSGIQTLEDKETDRVSAVETELKKLTSSKIIETYKDHRMAMSFAPLSLKFGEIQINNAEVVSKSYPNFWKDLEKGGFKIFPLTDSNN